MPQYVEFTVTLGQTISHYRVLEKFGGEEECRVQGRGQQAWPAGSPEIPPR